MRLDLSMRESRVLLKILKHETDCVPMEVVRKLEAGLHRDLAKVRHRNFKNWKARGFPSKQTNLKTTGGD